MCFVLLVEHAKSELPLEPPKPTGKLRLTSTPRHVDPLLKTRFFLHNRSFDIEILKNKCITFCIARLMIMQIGQEIGPVPFTLLHV